MNRSSWTWSRSAAGFDGRVLLVTGSAGSIGSEICRQLLQFSPRRLVLLDRSETGQFFLERELRKMGSSAELEVCIADVLDRERIRDVLRQHRPDVVFHAAAYKHVPLMETHPAEAVKNIVVATRQMADLSAASGAGSFVLISTDKAVHPTSVMGVCKRTAELYVQSQADHPTCRFVTVRFGNVLDSAGSVAQVFRQQIAAGGPVTVTDPAMERFFMTIPEASRLVIQAGAIGNGGEILVLDMGDPVRIVDLATDMIRLSGLRVGDDIALEFTGLRPGEKLYEELHIEGEEQVPTCHPKIIVADSMSRDPAWIAARINELQRLAHRCAGTGRRPITPDRARILIRRRSSPAEIAAGGVNLPDLRADIDFNPPTREQYRALAPPLPDAPGAGSSYGGNAEETAETPAGSLMEITAAGHAGVVHHQSAADRKLVGGSICLGQRVGG